MTDDPIIYEWDETKRQNTLQHRLIDFADMVRFEWDTALTVLDDRMPYEEQRYFSLGYIDGRLFACAWCYRGENIRIISMRKANAREVKRYEQISG